MPEFVHFKKQDVQELDSVKMMKLLEDQSTIKRTSFLRQFKNLVIIIKSRIKESILVLVGQKIVEILLK
ncbi:hypothetical protein SDC9_141376 [bioreactor metagenome]|uniref:Uncharacterized protein n=1 Tax=bioreactor metagenome TaxID=1076179 RepID=A0A645DY41_9ZZZZ